MIQDYLNCNVIASECGAKLVLKPQIPRSKILQNPQLITERLVMQNEVYELKWIFARVPINQQAILALVLQHWYFLEIHVKEMLLNIKCALDILRLI